MDSYPQLFDVDGQLDSDLFQDMDEPKDPFFYRLAQKQPEWLSNPFDTILPQTGGIFCDNHVIYNVMPSDQPSFNYFPIPTNMNDTSMMSGMPRGYVSLRQVNSFVANADSTKHSLSQFSLDDYRCSSSDSNNDDSEDEYWSRKSMPNIFSHSKKGFKATRRGSAPHLSLSSLVLHDYEEESVRKGRNVDKACNHCKRSHLRCDDMRPCRRCVSTGKTGCKDVEHKPRGRPKLPKNCSQKITTTNSLMQ